MTRLCQNGEDMNERVKKDSLKETTKGRTHSLSLCVPEPIVTFLHELSKKIHWTLDAVIEAVFTVHAKDFHEDFLLFRQAEEFFEQNEELLAKHLGYPIRKEGDEGGNGANGGVRMIELEVNLRECIVRCAGELSEEHKVSPARFIEQVVAWTCETFMKNVQEGSYWFFKSFISPPTMRAIIHRLLDELAIIQEDIER